MKSSGRRNKDRKKKPYVKPDAKQVPLRPEEAVLGFCKGTTSAGPLQPTCSSLPGCFSSGS